MIFTSKSGKKWYLHSKEITFGTNNIKKTNFFFKKEKNNSSCSLPIGYTVSETSSGLPVLKKIR
jgi:hypothetical protein